MDPSHPDHAWVNFESQSVEVDGEVLPIVQIVDRRGRPTIDFEQAAVIIAGRGSKWVSMRLLSADETLH